MRRPLPGWKPVLFLLEREGFDSALYHAAQVKALPGRPKSGLLIELADVVAAHRPRRRRNGTGGSCRCSAVRAVLGRNCHHRQDQHRCWRPR